ncbi:MAG: LytTR family DNA-binding domain-containing protein [Caloramator sp.]|nr:LytTR family DNA-binding domain-containing protein [Caloramator sp.]
MQIVNCIIVEDEMPAIEELKFILKNYDFINIKEIFNDGRTALNWLKENKVDVVFLDINMPEMSGLDLAKEIAVLYKEIYFIFITAYEEYALKAFEVGAIDYILKPFNEKRIEKTLIRLREYIEKYADKNSLEKSIKNLVERFEGQNRIKKLACEKNEKIILLDLDSIYFCYIENEKTLVKTKDKIYFTNYTLNEIEEKTGFFRIHKSYLVNLNKIKEIYPWFNGTYKIIMNDDEKTELQVSRLRVKDLKEALGI